MRARRARGPDPRPLPKVNPHPPLASSLSPDERGSTTPHASPRLVKRSKGASSRSPFMRGVLLLMAEYFNDWDLQAVVRSCGSVAHPDPPTGRGRPRAAAAPRPEAEAEAAEAAPTTPAAERGGEVPARAAPVAAAVQGHERAPPAVAPKGAALLYDLECLDLDHKPFLLPVTPSPRGARAGDDGREREVMISFPAAVASTSGMQQQRAVPPGRKAGARTPRPKRSKKSQLKKVVREMPVADGGASSSDPWAWRKYGQKPIKGSPYPRGYYKCSSMKGCMARKLVERSPAKPGVLIVTYMAEHCHPVPTQLNALAGTTRHKSSSSGAAAAAEDTATSSPRSHEQQGPSSVGRDGSTADVEDAARCDVVDGNDKSMAMALEFGAEEIAAADDENDLWPAGMNLDELLAPVDDDFDFEHAVDEEDGMLGRRLSL